MWSFMGSPTDLEDTKYPLTRIVLPEGLTGLPSRTALHRLQKGCRKSSPDRAR